MFLKSAGVGSVGLAVGGALYRVGAVWWDQASSPELSILSVEEAEIVAAIADTIFPGERFPGGMPAATETGIVEFYDTYLAMIDEETSKLLRLLLHAIDEGSIFADFSGRRFRYRPAAEREEILAAWDRSWFSARRGAFTSLKILIAMGYTEHPDVIAAAGFDYQCAEVPEKRGDRHAALGSRMAR